ncbi:MAG: peptidoglycan-binding protein [Firmicutes bacterium]|nr:peptidoglycan-binding protein [Bacillota bacterium]
MPIGKLNVKVTTASEMLPIKGARVVTTDRLGRVLFEQTTDADGMTEYIALQAPDPELTLYPDTAEQGYSTYEVLVTADGFHAVQVHGVEILADIPSTLPIYMHPIIDGRRMVGDFLGGSATVEIPDRYGYLDELGNAVENVGEDFDDIVIPPPAVTLPVQSSRVGSNAQNPVRRVFIPTQITVHLGVPTNTAARNVHVPFVEYIANVASSEIFATWPDASIRANIHAIITFTLNRLYTEWYRSRGHNFDITNTTQFDQMYVHGRNIFQNLMEISAQELNRYVHRIGFANPLFTTYRANACGNGCLSQWGTVDLANRGFTPLQIIRNFYGQDTNIATTNLIQDVRTTYPGAPMRLGSPPSRYIQEMQIYLNRIRQDFPLIPLIANPNGVFGPDTDAAVRQFQRTNNLNPDGVIGPATWNRITQIWVAVTRLANLNSEGVRIGIGPNPPSVVLRNGSSGHDVRQLQWLLNYIGYYFEFVPNDLTVDGRFGARTENSVREFQRNFGLNPDGVVGPATWNKIYEVFRQIQNSSPNPAPIPPPPPPPQPPPPPPPTGGNLIGTVRTSGGNLNLRSGPGTNFGVVATLPNGTPLTVIGEQNGWYNVRTAGGQTGWVSMDFVGITPRPARVTTAGGNLNLRATPSTMGAILASIPNGTPLTITDISGNFFRTNFNGINGWVSRDFVQFVG